MFKDPIVEKIRAYRQQHAARYNDDLNLIVEALNENERQSGRVPLNLGPKLLSEQKTFIDTCNL